MGGWDTCQASTRQTKKGTTTEYPATKNDHVDSLQAYTERDTTTEYPTSKNGHVDSLQA